jgi:hypothetical protein
MAKLSKWSKSLNVPAATNTPVTALDSKQVLLDEARKLNTSITTSFLKLGGIFWMVKTNYRDEFPEFIRDVGVGYRTALYWVNIYKAQVELQIPADAVIEVGWTKMITLVKEDALGGTTEIALAAMAKAKKMTCDDLRASYNNSSKSIFSVALTPNELSFVKHVLRTRCSGEFVDGECVNRRKALMTAMKYVNEAP